MSKLVEVKWFAKPKNLCEIYQQTGMLFAFVSSPSNNLLQCHEWVKCRDFLADAVRTQITQKACAIYGFKFNVTENPPVDLNKMRMLVTKADLKKEDIPKFRQKMKNGLKLINHYETMAGVGKTKLREVDTTNQSKYKAIFLFIGSIMWLKSPFLVSMYSFLIRLGDKKLSFTTSPELKTAFKKLADLAKSGDTSDNDANYLIHGWDKLDLIIKNRLKLFPTKNKVHDVYWSSYSISTFHNSMGIVSLTKGLTPDKGLNNRIHALTTKNT